MSELSGKLGKKVKDRVSGFKGIVTGETVYLQGCHRLMVQPSVNKDGTMPKTEHFDEPDLIVISDGVKEGKPNGNGGPREMSLKKDH